MDPLKHPLILGRQEELQRNIDQIISAGYQPAHFCLMPFVNIILEPNGSVGLCRHKGTEHSLGNLTQHSWREIWNGDQAKKWRQEFIEGKISTCQKELKDQHCNLCPQLGKMFPKEPESFFSPTIDKPLRLTANFNGHCNLKCQMCDVWQMPNGYYTEENFWKEARMDLFPHLKEIDMLSGEPFLQEDTFKLIDEVSDVNPSCLWSITTNAHWRLNKKITMALDKIKIKNLILSVDSLDEAIYAKIRAPGRLSLVLENIKRLQDYEKERQKNGLGALNFNLNFVTQKDNWHEIPQVIHYCLENNFHPFITFCYVPEKHSVLNFSNKDRLKVVHHMINTFTWGELCLANRVLSPLIDSLTPLDKANCLAKMKDIKMKYESSPSLTI